MITCLFPLQTVSTTQVGSLGQAHIMGGPVRRPGVPAGLRAVMGVATDAIALVKFFVHLG